MEVQRSVYNLSTFFGNPLRLRTLPLWQTEDGFLIWPRLGVFGVNPPANEASGKVPAEHPLPFEVEDFPKNNLKHIVVLHPEGYQQVARVICVEKLDLASQ